MDIADTVDYKRFAATFGALDEVDPAKFDAIVPLSIADYDALQRKTSYLGTKYWLPNPQVVKICDDKLSLNRWLLDSEFADLVPPLQQSKSRQFPYIVKRRVDVFGRNSFVIRNDRDERAHANLLQSSDYFCQTYVPGQEEFVLHLLVVNDQVLYDQTVKYEFAQKGYARGLGHWPKRRTWLSTSEHVSTFARTLARLDYQGTCCIDYKVVDGAPRLLEINPRFGATLVRDVNRYLDVYLSSLGITERTEFGYHRVPLVQDNLKQRIQMRLQSYARPWVRKARRNVRNVLNRLPAFYK